MNDPISFCFFFFLLSLLYINKFIWSLQAISILDGAIYIMSINLVLAVWRGASNASM